jgi:hypothetical protein
MPELKVIAKQVRGRSRWRTPLAVAAVGLSAFAYSFWAVKHMADNQFDPNKPLPTHTKFRGAYTNTGTKDIGPDTDAKEHATHRRP